MDEATMRWSPGKRLGFVFLAVYFCVTIVPDILSPLPGVGELWPGLWDALMPVLGNAVFGIDEPIVFHMTGSGDTLWAWIQAFWLLVLSLVSAVAVVAIDHRRHDYARAYARLRVFIRYSLALVLFSYGFAKLTGGQFTPPSPMELTRTYGDSSPMGLVWTFMGSSTAYCWFAGLSEIVAAALLLSRRTTTLGALVACGVLANVVAINLCYDVPVKLYSSQLLLQAIFLAAHDVRRVIDLLIFNRPTAPADLTPPTRSRRARIARLVLKSGFVALVAVMVLMRVLAAGEGDGGTKGPLYGVWEVESYTVDGAARSLGDSERWRQLIIGEFAYAIVRRSGGEMSAFRFTHEPDAGTVTLADHRTDPPRLHVLRVEAPADGQLALRGPFAEAAIEVTLRRIDTEQMRLVTRGFRWVNENPYNY